MMSMIYPVHICDRCRNLERRRCAQPARVAVGRLLSGLRMETDFDRLLDTHDFLAGDNSDMPVAADKLLADTEVHAAGKTSRYRNK